MLKVSLNAEGVVMGVHGHDVMSKESDTDPGGPYALICTRTSTCGICSNSRMLIRIGSNVRDEFLCRECQETLSDGLWQDCNESI